MAYFGKALKQIMRQKKLSVKDIALAANLSINSVKNLLNNRSKKIDYIEQIADAYGIPVEYFTEMDSIIVNISCYTFAMSIVGEVMHKRNISSAPKEMVINLVDCAYDYLYSDKKNIMECRNYIAGMIEHALLIGQLVMD